MPPAIPLGTHLFLVAVPLLVIVIVLAVHFAGGKHGR
jgi:hypothetical protein